VLTYALVFMTEHLIFFSWFSYRDSHRSCSDLCNQVNFVTFRCKNLFVHSIKQSYAEKRFNFLSMQIYCGSASFFKSHVPSCTASRSARNRISRYILGHARHARASPILALSLLTADYQRETRWLRMDRKLNRALNLIGDTLGWFC
jgi:hypothetical protein